MAVIRRRNAVRTAAIATAAGAAILIPSAAAFASDAPQTSPSASQSETAGPETAKPGKKDEQKKEQPKGGRTFVAAKQLAGGFTAKIYKVGGHYEADIMAPAPDSGKTIVWDTLKTTGGKSAYGQHNGAHFVLNPDGTMTSWAEGGNKKKDEQKRSGQQTQVTPKGAVKAGAEGVGPADGTLLAAGGGVAAAGAAGLGFAMLRRRDAARIDS